MVESTIALFFKMVELSQQQEHGLGAMAPAGEEEFGWYGTTFVL
jgi:hypothetical protein